MKQNQLFIVLLAVISLSYARVVRDTETAVATNPEFSFENLFKSAQESLQHLETAILTTFGAKDSEELKTKAVQQGENLAKHFDTWTMSIIKDTDELKDLSAVKELRQVVDKAIEDFKAQHPDTAADIKNYAEKANKGTEEIINKIKNLADSKEAENIKNLSQKLAESAKDAVEKFTKTLVDDLKTQ